MRAEVNSTLERILDQNPQLVISQIELCTEIYYPIAILEIEMTETTFEDFDAVPLAVLKFVGAGLSSAESIAEIMGLSKNYIQKILDLLMGYGYLNQYGLTQLGKLSLGEEKKIAHAKVRQRFQADAVTGDLLKIGEQSAEANLEKKEETFDIIPHVPHIPCITEEQVNNQLKQRNLKEYKRYQGGILHANVEEISAISCVGLEYVKAFMIKMKGIEIPFVITYQYDASKEDFKERFRWLPIRVPNQKAYSEYGFDRSIPCYSEESLVIIKQIYKLVCKKITEINQEKVERILARIYPFDFSTMDVSVGRILDGVPEQISVYVNDISFTKWTTFLLSFLEKYDIVNGYLYTNSRLNGLFIRFESQNRNIMRVSKAYQKVLRHGKKRDINSFINKRLIKRDKESSGAFQLLELIDVLEQFENEKEHTKEEDI